MTLMLVLARSPVLTRNFLRVPNTSHDQITKLIFLSGILEDKFAVGSGARLISVCYFEQENDWLVI